MRSPFVLALLLAGQLLAPRASADGKATPTEPKATPAAAKATPAAAKATPVDTKASVTRRLVTGELAELTRVALATSSVRLPKGTKVLAARPSNAGDALVPIAPSRVTIDLTPPARRVGAVTAVAVLVFWRDADITARLPLHVELSVPKEALVFDVPRGGVVTLVVSRGLVEVTTPAVTSADADIGDVVQVLLRPSGRALRAELVAKDRALALEDGR